MGEKIQTTALSAIHFDGLPYKCKEVFFEFLIKYGFHHKSKMLEVLDFTCEGCKSPIEQIFRFAYELVSYKNFEDGKFWLHIYPQEKIKANGHRYVADFLFVSFFEDDGKGSFDYCKPLKVVIECDGHEFHEKTKEQVIRTNQRNYDLSLENFEILHFSGSEIVNNPLACAEKAYDFIDQKLEFTRKGIKKNGRKKNVH